jgi:hypothetical protein
MAHVTQIAVAPTSGTLYLLDSIGRVWQSKTDSPSKFERVELPKELEAYERK